MPGGPRVRPHAPHRCLLLHAQQTHEARGVARAVQEPAGLHGPHVAEHGPARAALVLSEDLERALAPRSVLLPPLARELHEAAVPIGHFTAAQRQPTVQLRPRGNLREVPATI